MADALLDPERVRRYLERLGTTRAQVRLDRDGLAALQRAHLLEVPFENLSIHLGEPVVLRPAALVDKLTVRHRGGFCYELNGAFAALLEALGFAVHRLEARVYGDGGVGIPFDHLCLGVDLGERYLVDVGFGATFTEPLLLDAWGPQQDPAGSYEVVTRPDGWRDLLEGGVPQYRFSLATRTLADFEEGCRYHQTSPLSHFTRNTVCTRLTPRGRVTLRGQALVVTEDGYRRESLLGDAELVAAYRDLFGIHLDRLPR